MAKTKAKTIIPEPLVQAVAKYCEGDTLNAVHVISSVLKANAHPKADTVDIAKKAYDASARARVLCYTAVALGKGFKAVPYTPAPVVLPSTTATISPHAPVPHTKRDYWVKVVTSVDPKQPNAWGVKGRFINPDDMAKLPEKTLCLVMTKHKKHRHVYVMASKSAKPTNARFPASSPNAPLVVHGSVLWKAENPGYMWWDAIMKDAVTRWGVKVL